MALILGDDDDNSLIGTTLNDVARLFGGNDYYHTNGGSDRVYCGDGNDRVETGFDPVTIYGEAGNDTLSGGHASDVIRGGIGNDTLWGGFGGTDTIYGGSGDDYISDGIGADLLDGGYGYDTLNLNTGGVFVFLGQAQMVLPSGSTIVNFEALDLSGGSADDDFTGGLRADLMRGGQGHDTIRGAGGDDFLIGDNGDDRLEGGSGNDRLTGGGGDDIVIGGGGNDILSGGGFNDLFPGTDWLDGGRGADTFNGSNGLTNITYQNSGRGVTVNLVNFTAAGGHAEGDVINTLVNVLEGSRFADVLTGGREHRGGGGNDILTEAAIRATGGDGLDSFVFTTARIALSSACWITDLDQTLGETIDLSAIDAHLGHDGDQAFTFLGQTAPALAAGELSYITNETYNYTLVSYRFDDSGQAGYLYLDGVRDLRAEDFVL